MIGAIDNIIEMKCPGCQHTILEEKAKFCSNCGNKLQTQAAVAQDSAATDNTTENYDNFTKRLSDDTHQKKKRKKRKKRKKKVEDRSTDPSPSDLSLVPTDDNKDTKLTPTTFSSLDDQSTSGKPVTGNIHQKMEGGEQSSEVVLKSPENPLPSSEVTEVKKKCQPDDTSVAETEETQVENEKVSVVNENATKCTQNDTQTQTQSHGKALQDSNESSKIKDQSNNNKKQKKSRNKKASSASNANDKPTQGNTQEKRKDENQTEKELPTNEPRADNDKSVNQNTLNDGAVVAPEDTQAVDAETSSTVKGNAKQKKQDDQTQRNESSVDKKSKKTPKQNTETHPSKMPPLDSSKGTKSSDQGEKQTKEKNSQEPNKQPLDQNANEEHSEKPTEQKQEQKKSDEAQSKGANQKMVFGPHSSTETTISGSSVDPPTNPENKALKPQKPIGTTTIAPDNRLTIHFHAVLSKDFKFIPDEDHLYIRAGKCLGTFEENLAELRVIKDLGDHGFLVGGTLTVPKSEVCSGSIPYKYFVFTNKKQKYEYEHIYKLDSQPPNRWLVVKAQLLSEDGDWYQYDDIIYARPSKNMLKRLKNAFWPENRNKLLQSREIAGKIMLEMIFDLKTRSDEDLRHFHSQLQQFFHVFEEREKAHFGQHSLGYGPDHVKNMLKEIMLNNAVPQLQKDVRKDPLKSAVVMVYVHKEFGITLKNEERCQLCHLLCLPNSNKEDFVQYWTTFSQEICFLKRLPDLLLSLINAVKTEEKPDWFLVLPLFHLLKGWTKPFENTLSGNLTLQSWTGLDGVVGCKNLSSQERKAIQHILWKNSHLLEVDPLLVRSFLYLMSLDEMLECINFVKPELLLLLQLYVDKIPQVINSTHFWAMITYITHNLIEEKFSLFSEDYGRDCMKTVITLLNQICSAVTPTPYGPNLSDIVIACMKLVASISDFVFSSDSQETDENKNLEHMRDLVLTALNITREWISRSFRDSLMNRGYSFYRQVSGSKEIKMWDEIISIQFKDGHCTTAWRKSLLQDFEGKYKKEPPLDQIEHYCVSLKESCSFPYLASVIEKCAVEAVTLMCQNKTEGKLFERMTINMKLITTVIENSWPSQDEETEVILEHLLSWTAAKHIFQRYVSKEGMERDISSDANAKIVAAISLFSDVIRSFLNGHIKIGLLKMILKYESTFLQLIKIDCFIEDKLYRDTEKMKRLLQQRQCEVAAIYREKDLVDTLVHRIHQLQEFMKVDAAAMEKRHQINLEEMHLNEFIEVHLFDQVSWETATPHVTYFNMDENTRCMAEKMYTFRDSYIFNMCWEHHVSDFVGENESDEEAEEDSDEEEEISLERIYEDIFQGCFDEYKRIYFSLKNGSLTLERIDNLFKDYKQKYEEMEKDLGIMCRLDPSDDKRWLQLRVQQIEQFHELHLAAASAEIIMTVKNTLHLQGDFSVLLYLLQVNEEKEGVRIDQIDNDLIQAKKDLVDITETRKDCLRELGLRGNFVRWVKEALEDINELKVFVDLASISAGENDMDVDRVACFHDAVLGYSPLLYELERDADFDKFNTVVKKLWRALENDCHLPKKLRDSARHLEWLKTVKDSHGSVELSSLSLASSINQKGIYIISAQHGKKLCLDKALELRIPEEHDAGQHTRNYSLEELRELQNKLMLMSGKGDQGQHEVDYFTEVFDNVQRLSEAFIALYTAGNPLFRHWEAQISCCTNGHDPSIMMDFNLGSAFGAVIIQGNLEKQLPNLCRKMEKCLEFWMDFVDKQRSNHYYLNYYTAEQIVYLCSHLSQEKVSHVDEQALMMLSFVKPDCSAADLRQVWHELLYDILGRPQEVNDNIEFRTFTWVENVNSDINSEQDFLPPLVQRTSGLLEFDAIWNTYMKDMKGSLPDVLDLMTFGRLLEILANKVAEGDSDEDISEERVQTCAHRELPNGLNIGKPNLIVCPHADILTSCISTYMSSPKESLPTHDEVLLCTPTTPYEQVELFLRRCFSCGYRGYKIYSLLYADVLTYDVSSKVESFFQRIKIQSRNQYRLVIFCSSEREHAYLPTAFCQFKVHMVPQAPLARVQEYLHEHYVVSEDQCSAAAAFKDRLCVGIVSSTRSGVGKSLYIKRLYQKLKHSTKKTTAMKCIRLIEPTVDEDAVFQSLLNNTETKALTVFHLDVTASVQHGLHEFLFKLLFLRYLMNSEGKVWKCNEKQLYVVEILERPKTTGRKAEKLSLIDVLPKIFCRPPKEVLELELRKIDDPTIINGEDPLMDDEEFRSAAIQRPYQYLTRFHNHADLDRFTYNGVEGSHGECLQMLLMHCGIVNPSWAELRNFAWFLNLQLQDCEKSVFCNADFAGETLVGFKRFVVGFMILMAKDFATPSLSITDQSPGRPQTDLTGVGEEDLAPFLIRKRWETEPHPYIFFNDDRVSMTFIGFHLQPNRHNAIDAIDPASGKVIKRNIMTRQLYDGLRLQRVSFDIDFDSLPRGEKIKRICKFLGTKVPLKDPDETYELTSDNILKILAIHMRFRCGIPVIIMGETGCGKTRLIKFLCELRKSGVATENMKLVKVHGGTTSKIIYGKVKEAESMAAINKKVYGLDSVLFFDEANTTDAISSIKEVLCDKTVQGEGLASGSGLQIVAACNPYRKHTDEMIERLESAGLGYRVRAEKTNEKLGSIPLRQLVYRVHALPPSMIPLVWDFGQLNDDTEKMYIQQIVQRVVHNNDINALYIQVIVNVLSASQKYMRQRKDECSFVSLRDVERCMQAFVWFFVNRATFFDEMDKIDSNQSSEGTDPVLWSLIMATGVCYHACLENKEEYRQKISRSFPTEYTSFKIKQEIIIMQDLLLKGVPMRDTIARNNALKENVFMMVVCIELRIPLFLVGKPGSSKSLSKTLVADAMQGQSSHSDIYKRLKQIHLVSFQCSPHSTPEGIINTFKQCGRFQEGKNLKEYISVVVLDEIGLAEDSPKMPLKTLHPLLEEGCIDDEPLPHKKVGFIGISNWALDPAKMNRGIFVSRGDPDEQELVESAKGICSSDKRVLEMVRDLFKPFAKAYLEICQKQRNGFFGLRDFYSLIKMVFAVAKQLQRKPPAEEIMKAVLRNFSGRVDVDAVTVFKNQLHITPNLENISAIEFVKENIQAIGQEEECRYLLVLTKNYAALQLLQQTFFKEDGQPEIIFGSSFPKDQEYTQICRNINRVKICMETGQTVVLLNLQNLYESLYDALNQYYVHLGGQKYVDLGLGTHRVKCRVHKDFRLIVIEEREVVYEQFPIPLINRLEKHFLDIHTVLKSEHKTIVGELEKWVKLYVSLSRHRGAKHEYKPAEVFIGYHSDTCASVVLQVLETQKHTMEIMDPDKKVLDEAKLVLLQCATPDSVVRLDSSELPRGETDHLAKVYNEEKHNGCLSEFILAQTGKEQLGNTFFTEVTTFSRLLTASDLKSLEQNGLSAGLLSVRQFDTEHSFLKKIRNFLTTGRNNCESKILIVQCDYDEASQSANLIASAKHSSINEIRKTVLENPGQRVFVYIITRLPRMIGGTSYVGFYGGPWKSVHIDDLRKSNEIISDIKLLQRMTISQLFENNRNQPEALEVNDDIYVETEKKNTDSEKNENRFCVLDTTTLLRSCVQRAVGMLRDQMETGFRSTLRVEILLTLLDDDDDEIKEEFSCIVKRHLHTLLATHVDSTIWSNNWVMREASNIDALQEGGTFRNTLWNRIQAVVIPMLAHLVAISDRDQNLNLLLDKNCGLPLKKLWLDIFGNDKLLQINSESRTVLVQNYITPKMRVGCSMPFSWRIRDYLEDMWVHALQNEGQTQLQFDDFFWNTPLGRFIGKEDQETQTEFYHRYLQDYISLTMNVSCEEEMQLLSAALNSCVNELKIKLEATDRPTSLSWIHAAHEFKNRLQNLSRIICIKPQVTGDLLRNPSSRDGPEMILDVYAAFACVENLEPTALDTDDQRQTWLRQVHQLQVPIELVCAEDCVQLYGERSKAFASRVLNAWNRIFCLSLFVEHMLVGIEELDQKLVPSVLQNTQRLWQMLEKNTNMKTKDAFETVIGLLKTCKEGAVECIFRFGLPRCSVCIGDPQDPICLPCQHIYCLVCIKQWLVPGQMYCPYCMQQVNDDFAIVPSNDIRVQINTHAQFRRRCNAFFVELVSSMCFKDNSPPSSEVVSDLLSFLMHEANPALIPGAQRQRVIVTKEFSPFDESLDKSPVVRSVVLKLLLKYSFDKIEKYLKHYLHAVEESNLLDDAEKTELYSLYINCFEDSMFEKLCLEDESIFLQLLSDYPQQILCSSTVDSLQLVARVRLNLDIAAGLIIEDTTLTKSQAHNAVDAFLKSVKNLCQQSKNDWYRVYLIRKLGTQHGVAHVQNLLKFPQMSWIFPKEILEKADEAPMDFFLVCGPDYQTIRNAVAKVVMDGTMDDLDGTCERVRCVNQSRAVLLLLALYREVTTWYKQPSTNLHPKPAQIDLWMGYIGQSKVLTSPELKAFAQALVTNQLGPLTLQPALSRTQSVLIELTVHLAAVLLCGNQGILGPLKQLALTPRTMQAAFLPSMPEDKIIMAQQAMGQKLRWYLCPNGHPCTIGECGRPMERSRCVDCGADIGGINHIPAQGFMVAQLQGDRTQSGHILGDPGRRNSPDMLDTKSLSPVPFAVVRMITHMAMMFGLCNDAQMISTMIKPRVVFPGKFLFAHLTEDQRHLTKSLGKGADDAVITVHLIISSLLHPPHEHAWPVGYDNQLSTNKARNNWENKMSNIIAPLLKNMERQLKQVNALIRSDDRISASPIMKVMFGDPQLFLDSLPKNSLIHCSTVWSSREKVSLFGLTHILEQNGGKEALPFLWTFLHREAEYRLVKFLPDILTLQKHLVKKFQNITEVSGTIADFLEGQQSVSLKAWYEKHIKIVLNTWNELRVFLATNGDIKLPPSFCEKDLDRRSDFRVLLPSRRGPGLCSTALVSYLIFLQNDLLYSVDRLTGEDTSYKVSPVDLTDLHVIRYELDKDLMPLVLSNTQYSIEKGQETLHEYDLPKIQQQIVSRFLLGKPLITLNGIPTLVHRHDRNYENILKDVNEKIKQEPLQTLIQCAVGTELDSYSEVCEALSAVEIALGFLAMTGGDASMQLSCYLEDVLKMATQTPPHILKALSMCSLKHCAALWQLLGSLKSQGLLKLKRDPFEHIPEEYKQVLSVDERGLLARFFSKNSAETFLLEMHEFLVLMLNKPKATDTFKPEWGLKETLVSYMERKDMDVPPELEELFPEEICLSQYVEAWKCCVSFKQERTFRN